MCRKPLVSRRGVLVAGGAATILSLSGAMGMDVSRAAAQMQNAQVPGFYRFRLGDFEVTILSDGSFTLPTDLLGQNRPRDEVKAYLEANFLDPGRLTSHVNIPLINTGEELILVDVGGGGNFLTGAGQLVTNMQASGYNPEDIDKVILTHGHPDHIWGLIDDFDELAFPNAKYFLSRKEWDFWGTGEAKSKLPDMFQAFAAGASRRLPLIDENCTRVKPGEEFVPGFAAIDTAGHTPGHLSLLVQSGTERLLISADAITHPAISFEHPGWWPRTDLVPELAEKSRRKILDMAATDRTLMLSYHLSFPGLGHVARAGQTYRWHPAMWQWQL